MKPKNQSCHFFGLTAITLAFTLSSASAVDGTWTGAAATEIWGGTGNWVSSTVASGTGFTANFTGEYASTQNCQVNTARTIGNITFTDTTPTHDLNLTVHPSNFALTLDVSSGASVINVTQPGRTVTINTIVAGADGLTKSGAGTLVLAGSTTASPNTGATFTGLTTVSAGTLSLTGNRSASMTGLVDVTGGGAVLNIGGDLPMASQQLRVGSGTSTTGTINQTAGLLSFTGGSQVTVGTTSTSQGIYNLSGGTLSTASSANRGVIVGTNASCNGIFNLSGTGTLTMASGSSLQIPRSENVAATGAIGSFNQTGGTATVSELRMGGNTAANNASQTGTLNLSAGIFTASGFSALSGGNSSNSTINISGTADVTLPAFPTTRGTGATATITFDGGTLKPAAASATYMGGLSNAFVKAGGVKIDTANGSITVTQALLADALSLGGGLTKAGSNTLTLTGANSYTGATLASAGTLQWNGSAATLPTTSGLTVSSGATFGFTAGTASTLDLSGKPLSLGGTLAFDMGASGANDSLTVGDFSLTANSTVTFNPIGAITTGGSYTLLTSANPINTNGFTLAGQPIGRFSFTPTINANTVTVTPLLNEGTWNQTGGGDWSLGDPKMTSGNWTNYKPTVAGDAALFGSSITAPSTINVDTAHVIGYLRFDNANAYTIGNGASGNLTLDNGSLAAPIVVTSGSHVIAENVTLASNALVSPASGAVLNISGALSGTGRSLSLGGPGTLILSGNSTFTGSTTVSTGTLNITGSLAGDVASSKINIHPSSGNAIVNYGGGTSTLFAVTGANVAGTASVFNMTAGSLTISPGTTTGTQSVSGSGNASGNGAYGYYNITGGTFKDTSRFTLTGQAAASPVTGLQSQIQTAVVHVGGTGFIDQTSGEWMLNYSLGQTTVTGSGKIDRTGAGSPFGIFMNHATGVTGGGYGVLNLAGTNAEVILGTAPIRFGNSATAGQGEGQSGFVNLAAGTLSAGANTSISLPAAPAVINNAYYNFAGATLKATANLTGWIPASSAAINLNSNIYGGIDNSAVSGAPANFTGGFNVDTNTFNVAIANPLQAPGGAGVTQADLSVSGGSGYIGAPAVIFSSTGVIAGGSPAAGYALISGGAVTGIVITAPGTYTPGTIPTVTLIGGGGTGASVTAAALNTANTSGGLTKTGLGTLTLTGANTYTGATLVSAGTLQLDGSAATTPATASITANSGSSLGFTSGSASILNLNGKILTLGSGNLAIDIGSTAVNDSITVGDFALTANSTISLNPIGPINSGGSHTLLTSTNPIVTGGFTLTATPAGRLSGAVTVNANTVTITPTLFEGIWNQSGGGNWSLGDPNMTSGNWTNYKPTVAGDAALFGSAIAAPSTVAVDAAHTLGFIRFDNSNAYTIGANGSSNLTLDNATVPAFLVVSQGSHVIAENVALNSNLLAFPATGTTLNVSGNISGTGRSLQLSDAGTLVLSGSANTYDGATTVSNGTLSLTGSLTGNTAITTSGSGVLTQSSTGVISGTSTVTQAGSGISTLDGANTYTGTTNISLGKLILSGARTGTSGAITVGNVAGQNAILDITNGTHALASSRFNIGNMPTTAASATVNQSGGAVSFTGGDMMLIGQNTAGNTGTYNLSGGSITTNTSTSRGIIIGTNGATVGSTTGIFNLSGTGVLNMTAASGGAGDAVLQVGRYDSAANNTIASFSQTGGTANVGLLSVGGNGTLGSGISSTVTLTGGVLVANQFPRLALGDANTALINIGGTADVTLPAFPTARGAGSTATINFDGGTLKPKAASATYMGGLTNAFIKAGGAKFDTTGFDITITQDLLTDGVSTGGGLTKAGTNTLTLTGNNTYTGGTAVQGGVLGVNNSNALGTGTATLNGGIRFLLGNGVNIANGMVLGANAGVSGNGLIQVATGNTATVSGPISITNVAAAGGHFMTSGTGVLNITGVITSSVPVNHRDGTSVFSGGGTGYTDMTHASGTVRLGANNGIATTATMSIANSAAATFDLAGFNQTMAGVTNGVNAATIGNSSTTSNSLLTTTGTSSFAGIIQDVVGSGTRKVALTVDSGTLTLTGANTFSGDITVNAGTLIGAGATNSPGITVLGARSNTRNITVNNGGILRLNSGNVLGTNHTATTAPTLVINSGGTVTNGGIATNNALNNVLLDGGTLTSTTGHTSSSPPNAPVYGAWNLNGSVTSTGTSAISTSDPAKGWIMLKVVGDKTTDFNVTSGTLTVSAPVVDNPTDGNIGSLGKSGAGAMVLSGVNNYTGDTIVNAGSLQLADNAQLKFALGATSGTNNSISGAGTVTLDGDFTIDTTAADALATGTWTLENVPALPGAYGSTFSVVGFTDAGNNKWTKPNGPTKIYTFDETTGVLTLGASAGYPSWASANAGGQAADLDFDNDGTSNGVEYFMNAAAGFTANPQLNGSNTITWPNGGNIPASAYGTQFVVQTSPDLSIWTDVPLGQLTTNTDGPGGSLTYQLTGAAPRFVRLVVTPN
jgi:autotransporter-associated beta strand protein